MLHLKKLRIITIMDGIAKETCYAVENDYSLFQRDNYNVYR